VRLEYDKEADAVYIYFSKAAYSHGKKLDAQRRIDYGPDGSVRGVELLNVTRGVDLRALPEQEEISRLLEKENLKVLA
jgi:uncharacterized protein YuzE